MRSLTILLVVAIAGTARPELSGRIIVNARPADVRIGSLAPETRLILLPALEYTLTIEPQCAPDMQAESISISIADTRKTIRGIELDEQPVLETTIRIPRKQVGPLAVDDFCRSDQSGTTPASVRVADVFTAQLSLSCVGEEARTIVYVSEPLDVNLQCHRDLAEPGTGPAVDQAPASAAR